MELLSRLLGSGSRLKILRLFVFNKDTSLTLADVAERTKLSKEVVRSDLNDLAASGFLRKKASSPARYQTNPRFEHLEALDVFIRETTSVRPDIILKAL